jgi:peroxiredoxin
MGREMVKSYGMFAGEKPFNCASRGTVVIGPDGNVLHSYGTVDPKTHPQQVLQDL